LPTRRPWDGEHDLADEASLGEGAEGAGCEAEVVGGDGQRPEDAAGEQRAELGEHLPDPIGAGLEEIEGAVGDARVVGGDACGVAEIGLAHLEEAAAAREEPEGGVDEVAGEAVEDDVDALARGGAEEVGLEVEGA